MSTTTLLIDADYLCHRAFHSLGDLSYGGNDTGTLFGFLRDLTILKDRFAPDVWVFGFDAGVPLRRAVYPKYKQTRRLKKRKPEEQRAYDSLKKQMRVLRFHLLKSLGFSNVFWQVGYEADDVLAGISEQRQGDVIIVGADHDLYQLIRDKVSVWHPNRYLLVTRKKFRETFGIEPTQWPDVKAIAGCGTDDVQGVKGVGEKTACRFLSGELKKGKKYEDIVSHNHIWERNLRLVRLPYEGLQDFEVRPDQVTDVAWKQMCDQYGFRSLRGMVRWGKRARVRRSSGKSA